MAFADFVRLLKTDGLQETFYLEYLAVHQYLGDALTVRIYLYVLGVMYCCSCLRGCVERITLRVETSQLICLLIGRYELV